jgi:pimeloyl-ACP methyl ester carboxylesterase
VPSHRPHSIGPAFEGIRDYDLTEAGGVLTVAALYVAANEPQPRSDMGCFREIFPQVLDSKTAGSGHFCQLEVPEQVNAMIDRFLASTLPA